MAVIRSAQHTQNFNENVEAVEHLLRIMMHSVTLGVAAASPISVTSIEDGRA